MNPTSNCKVANWYTDQDSCQGQDYQRCSTCGANEGSGCMLTQDVIAHTLLKQEREKVTHENRILNAKYLVKDLVRCERLAQDQYSYDSVQKEVAKQIAQFYRRQGAWRTIANIFALGFVLDMIWRFV